MNNTSQPTEKQRSDLDYQASRDFINTLFDSDTKDILVITVQNKGNEDLQIQVGDVLIVGKKAAPKAGDVCIYKLEEGDLYGFDFYDIGDEKEFEIFGVIHYHIRKINDCSVLNAEVIL